MTEVLYGVATMVAGPMVGSELAIAAFVHPTLDRLPDDVHLRAASALARVQGRIMPFWYILVVLLTLGGVGMQWHQSGRLPILVAASAILWVCAIVFSVTALVPINNHLESNPPPDWKMYRRGWDLLHRLRVVLLTAAFGFLFVELHSKSSCFPPNGTAHARAQRASIARLAASKVPPGHLGSQVSGPGKRTKPSEHQLGHLSASSGPQCTSAGAMSGNLLISDWFLMSGAGPLMKE